MSFTTLWEALRPIGRGPDGGYHRLAWTDADLACRAWFREQAALRDLTLDEDGNGNQWAWVTEPGPDALITGSHLDSVPGGGAYDGPLGVVSAFLAADRLRSSGSTPGRPLAIVNFTDEEGRFGVACAGSRLLTGSLDPEAYAALTDRTGQSAGEARARAGLPPVPIGLDEDRLARMGTYVELHVEQGRRMVDLGVAVGVAIAVWPHGRWRLDFAGAGDHAGTTRLADRRDPVIPLAHTVLAARRAATEEEAVATVGRLDVVPGATNAIASHATAWLDARAPSEETVKRVVAGVEDSARHACAEHGVNLAVAEESYSAGADFGADLRAQLAAVVERELGATAELPTGAGHDAAVLAGHLPTAMLFVRNPTGVSHAPAEGASEEDCLAGVDALAAVLEALW